MNLNEFMELTIRKMGCMSSKMKAAVAKAGDELVEAAAEAVVDVAKDAMKDGVTAVKEIVKEAIEDGKEIAVAAIEEGKETVVEAIKGDDAPAAASAPAPVSVNARIASGINIEIPEIIIDPSKIPLHIADEIAARAATQEPTPLVTTE